MSLVSRITITILLLLNYNCDASDSDYESSDSFESPRTSGLLVNAVDSTDTHKENFLKLITSK